MHLSPEMTVTAPHHPYRLGALLTAALCALTACSDAPAGLDNVILPAVGEFEQTVEMGAELPARVSPPHPLGGIGGVWTMEAGNLQLWADSIVLAVQEYDLSDHQYAERVQLEWYGHWGATGQPDEIWVRLLQFDLFLNEVYSGTIETDLEVLLLVTPDGVATEDGQKAFVRREVP